MVIDRVLRLPGCCGRFSTGVALASVLIGILYGIRLLASADWDPGVFLQLGVESPPEIVGFVESEVGRSLYRVESTGHDGKFFFAQALDPFLSDPATLDSVLDRPRYRAGRMLYPLIAGGLGLLPAGLVVWMLPTANLVAMALGSVATSRLAADLGMSRWFGLAFALNPAVLSEFLVSGSGILALTMLCWAVVALLDEKEALAGWLMTGAVLARETMLISLGGLALGWLARRRNPFVLVFPPLLLNLAWRLWVALRLSSGVGSVTGLLGPPFRGLREAASIWFSNGRWTAMIVGVALSVISVWLAVEAIRRRSLLALAAGGYALLLPMMETATWLDMWDSTRALAPVLMASTLLILARTLTIRAHIDTTRSV